MEKIESLRKMVRIVNATFAYANQIQFIMGRKLAGAGIEKLCKECEEELNKEIPNIELVSNLIQKMESCIKKLPIPNFKSGGIKTI